MTQQELNDLIDKVNNGTATDKELGLYTRYLNNITSGDEAWDVQELGTEESVKNELQNRIELIRKPVGVKKVSLWPRIIGVAAAVAVIVLGIWFFSPPRHLEGSAATRNLINDIAPGKNTATLTLANGKTIILSDVKTGVIVGANKLSYNDGTAVEREESGQGREDVVMSTPRGGTYQITLPDGSRAWLNADTKISFPSQFIGKERKILLINGEVYFEVAKNKEKPFIVVTDKQEVEVLGTHFNISSYADEAAIKTTLIEGSVKVSSFGQRTTRSAPGEAVILHPNQQSLVTDNKEIKVVPADVSEAIAWKNGDFVFKEEPLESILRRVARWYDIDVVYEDQINERFTGTVSRNKKISEVLYMLERAKGVHFRIEGKKVTVSR
ncbi:ferric-dicitrate binding protein FerR (iron transport regulator) [Pedobacter sp. AK017]|uniref:FecR family protein n=1 Tax=Pedobacter sp. AK017 TaxID=2723073 RepID=UPI0016170528|nr:FecR family protein [Pedobacter sp. AK017]MBB5439525.1 ferric-dicitrate binding protein FerR (iron transport regulator) [Pedobacter sp. AK017]